jgi:hypothetical protein
MECSQPKGVKLKMRSLKLRNGVQINGHGALNQKGINKGTCTVLSEFWWWMVAAYTVCLKIFYCVPEHGSCHGSIIAYGASICWEFLLASQFILLHRRVSRVLTSSF